MSGIPRYSVTVTFVRDEAKLKSSCRHSTSTVASESYCKSYLSAHPTNQFTVTVNRTFRLKKNVSEPCIDVTLKNGLLKKLPLPSRVQDCIARKEHVKLPCSIWALVSLLIIVKDDIHVEDWFKCQPGQENSLVDEMLPAQILQAAHFMECGHVVDQFTEWALLAQSEVIDVFRAYRQDTANCTTLASRTAYLTKVLLILPAECIQDGYKATPGWLEKPVWLDLPLPLVTRWFSLALPKINLLQHSLLPSQWSALASGISQSPPGALKELHLSAWSMSDRCSGDLEGKSQTMLETVQLIVPYTPCMTALSLNNLVINEGTLSILEQIVCMLPPTLETLQLGFFGRVLRPRVRPCHRQRIFSAIAQIRSLKWLQVPHWDASLVGSNQKEVGECTAPLLSLPDLTIQMSSMVEGAPQFPSSLRFEVLTGLGTT